MGLWDIRGLRVPTNHRPAPLEVPQRPSRADTHTSSPPDSAETLEISYASLQPPRLSTHPPNTLLIPLNLPEPLHTPQGTRGTPKSSTDPSNQPPEPHRALPSPPNLHVDKAGGHARLAQQQVGQGQVASPHGQVQRCQAALGVLGARQCSGVAPQEVPTPSPKGPQCLGAQVCAPHGDPAGRCRGLWGAHRCCRGLTPLPNPPKVP